MVNSLGGERQSELLLLKDLASETGYSVYTLKYYLKLGLIRESRRSPQTNYRFFNQETCSRLRRIHDLRREGRSLKEIGEILK